MFSQTLFAYGSVDIHGSVGIHRSVGMHGSVGIHRCVGIRGSVADLLYPIVYGSFSVRI